MGIKKAVIKKAVKDFFADVLGEEKAEELTQKVLEDDDGTDNQDTEIPITGEGEETKTPTDVGNEATGVDNNQDEENGGALEELLDEANEILGEKAEELEEKAEESDFGTGLSGIEDKIEEMEQTNEARESNADDDDRSVEVDIEGELETLMDEESDDEDEN